MTLRALPTSSSPKRMPFLVVGRPYRVMSAILILGAVQRPAEVSIALLLVFAFSLLRFGKYRFA